MNDLNQEEIQILNEARGDEYSSWVTYNQIIADFGEIQPCSIEEKQKYAILRRRASIICPV